MEKWVQSCCVLCVFLLALSSIVYLTRRDRCSNGCAIDVAVKDGQVVGLRGREVDRINKGRLGPKGCAPPQSLSREVFR